MTVGPRMVHIKKQSLPSITLRCLETGNTFADLTFSFWTCTLLKAIKLYDWTGHQGCRTLRLPEFLLSPTHRPQLLPGDIPGTHRGWVDTGAIVWTKGLSRSNTRGVSINSATPYPVHTSQDAINDITMTSWMFDVQSRTCLGYRQTIYKAADLNVLKPGSKLSSKISLETTVRF
jgi:hypothetical protein